jgi:hypothetical protein
MSIVLAEMTAERDRLREANAELARTLQYIAGGMGNMALEQIGIAGVHGINDGKQRAIYLEDFVTAARAALTKAGSKP